MYIVLQVRFQSNLHMELQSLSKNKEEEITLNRGSGDN